MSFALLLNIIPTYLVTAAADQYFPLVVSGFNADIVADSTNIQELSSVGCVECWLC